MTNYSKWAQCYDAIYSNKDFEAEARELIRLVRQYQAKTGTTLLDVACGTGQHLQFFQRMGYHVFGMDISPAMLKIAKKRNPTASLSYGDMLNLNPGQRTNVVTCLFSAIGYVKTLEKLNLAIASMANCVLPGGVLVVEPWFTPQDYKEETVHAVFVDQKDLKIARINVSKRKGNLSILDFHFLIGTPAGVESFIERHELGLFTHDQYRTAFERAGLDTRFIPDWGRGLYLGLKPI